MLTATEYLKKKRIRSRQRQRSYSNRIFLLYRIRSILDLIQMLYKKFLL